jgi:hypothetical protein
MVLYAFCLHPFLRFLNRKMKGIMIGNRTRPTAVAAYADDVTIFVTKAEDFAIIKEDINLFEEASGARLNPRKSKALAIGGWNNSEPIHGIEYYPSIMILVMTFWGTTRQSMNDTWTRQEGKVRMQAKKAYDRDACIAHRLHYTSNVLLSKLWYIAQIMAARGRTRGE